MKRLWLLLCLLPILALGQVSNGPSEIQLLPSNQTITFGDSHLGFGWNANLNFSAAGTANFQMSNAYVKQVVNPYLH